jgi:hypothetical protein
VFQEEPLLPELQESLNDSLNEKAKAEPEAVNAAIAMLVRTGLENLCISITPIIVEIEFEHCNVMSKN